MSVAPYEVVLYNSRFKRTSHPRFAGYAAALAHAKLHVGSTDGTAVIWFNNEIKGVWT